jgi:hypothetical protein
MPNCFCQYESTRLIGGGCPNALVGNST